MSEFIVHKGKVKQAGADRADTAFVAAFRKKAERDLFTFAVGVLDYTFLTEHLHQPVCRWLQRIPPQRKMLLMPRDHGKSTIVARTLPLHMFLQQQHDNIYFPGLAGTETRVLLCGETEKMAKDNLRVLRTTLEENQLYRGLWPQVCWENPRRDAKTWNDGAIIINRQQEYSEPTVDAVGVGGARTGKHPTVIIKDDITTEAAANSPVIMQTAIDWHVNTRAMLPPHGLEFISATYWTPDDLPHYVERDPSVAVNKRYRSIVDTQEKIIWPEYITAEKIDQLMKEYGPRFHLLYMNRVLESGLTDFNRVDLRLFDLEGQKMLFHEDDRDYEIFTKGWSVPQPLQVDLKGQPLANDNVQMELRKRAYRIRPT